MSGWRPRSRWRCLGLSVAYGTSRSGDGYVVPIDSALQIARQIAGQ